jgi:sugar lactone lactonase YvrE
MPSFSLEARRTSAAGLRPAAASAPTAEAVGVAFTGGFAPVGGSFNSPAGVAVDAHGDIFVGLLGSSVVQEIPASCLAGASNASCVQTIGGGFTAPEGVAVDAAGDVFVANEGVGVVEVSASCIAGANDQTCEFLVGGPSDLRPIGVAVDAAGDVYVADADHGHPSLKEVPASCIAGANNASCVVTLYSDGGLFTGLALDARGSLFASTVVNGVGSVIELEAVDGVLTASPVIRNIGGGYGEPVGLVIDANGNLFVADEVLNALLEVPASCIAGAKNASCTVTAAAVPYATGVAVGPSGQLVVSEPIAGIVMEQNPQIQSVSLGTAVNVCPAGATTPAPCSQTVTLTYNIAAGTTIDPTKFLTLGGGNLDFKATPNDTSTTL